jgi:hypothetical protein
MLPAVTTYDSTSGLVSNKIGILDYETVEDDEGDLTLYTQLNGYGNEMDRFVPTVRAVAEALDSIVGHYGWSPLGWSSIVQEAINAYSTTFDPTATHVNGNWPYQGANKLVNGTIFANSLALKQNKLPVQDTNLVSGQQVIQGVPSAVIAPTGTAGEVTQVALWDADSMDPASWDINTYFSNDEGFTNAQRSAIRNSIPTVGAVEVGLNSLQQNIIPAGTAGEILTYSGTAGQLGTPWAVLSSLTGDDGDAIENYSTTFNGTVGNWQTGSAGKLITTNVLALGLSLKQNRINPSFVTLGDESGTVNLPSVVSVNQTGTEWLGGDYGILSTAKYNALATDSLMEADDFNAFIEYPVLETTIPTVGFTNTMFKFKFPSTHYSISNSSVASGSVFVSTDSDGVVSQRGIATAPTYDANNNLTNGSWLPTMSALMNQIGTATETLTWDSDTTNKYETAATNAYSTTFASTSTTTSGQWPMADAGKIVTTESLAEGLALKQNKIAATSDGANSTPNYVYHATNNPTADGSVITTTGTEGIVSQRGIATAPTYTTNNNVTTLSNGDWLPTMSATLNEMAKASVHFYGTSNAGATDEVRNVTIDGITELTPGLMIIVKPSTTANYDNATAANAAKLNLNNLGPKVMHYNGAALTTTNDGYAWKKDVPGLWIYDGTYWNFAGYDANSTYNAMTDGASGSYSGPAGTATTNTVVSPKVLKNTVLDGITLTANTGRTAFDANIIVDSPITSSDTIIQAFGHTQGQINNKQSKKQCYAWETDHTNDDDYCLLWLLPD